MIQTQQRPFTIFRLEETAKNLIRAFVQSFFSNYVGVAIRVPDLGAYRWSKNPEERFIRIAELFGTELDTSQDSFPEVQFPLFLITYPEFNQAVTGVGSMLNKQEGYFISDQDSHSFHFHDIITDENVVLSYKTKEKRTWKVRRYYYNFSLNFDILADTTQSRQELANLIRVMFDQYLADLSPSVDLSIPFFLHGYQYSKDDDTISFHVKNDKRTYPMFFPFGEVGIYFDAPILSGTGDYDNLDIFGESKLYSSSFTMDAIRLECFQLVETIGFVEHAELIGFRVENAEI